MSAILDQIRQLPVEERLQWLDDIWESIAADAKANALPSSQPEQDEPLSEHL